MQKEIEKRNNYVKINKFSEEIINITITDNQRHLISNLILEMQELNSQLNNFIKTNTKVFILSSLLFIEGASSSLIEGTRVNLEDFAYYEEEINNIPDWETRNLINLYEKYLFNDYHISHFNFSVHGISQLHVDLYEYNNNSKFKMTYDPSLQIKKVKPGKILKDDKLPNFISADNKIDNASLILLKPSLKEEYLNDLLKTIETKIKEKTFLIDHILLIHPIFEVIHPFSDGNGRIGRLFLSMVFKMLYPKFKFPICLSEAFENNKDEYKQRLQQVQKDNSYDSWNQWIHYFINCLILTKRRTQDRVNKIIELYNKVVNSDAFSTPVREQMVSEFFKYYKINKQHIIKKIQSNNNVSLQTIYNDWNIVNSILGIKDNKDGYFFFSDLYNILKNKK